MEPAFAACVGESAGLDAVRALHQTVVALRLALDKSRADLQALQLKVSSRTDPRVYTDTIERLSLENHILRQRVLGESCADMEAPTSKQEKDSPRSAAQEKKSPKQTDQSEEVAKHSGQTKESAKPVGLHAKDSTKSLSGQTKENVKPATGGQSKESLKLVSGQLKDNLKPALGQMKENAKPVLQVRLSTPKLVGDGKPETQTRQVMDDISEKEKSDAPEKSELREPSVKSLSEDGSKTTGDSDNESEELDDIELIFTTEETKELGVLQEDLVSFTDSEVWQPVGMKFTELDQFEEAPEEGDDRLGESESMERVPSNLSKTWAHSVRFETYISEYGVAEESEVPGRISRRNTLPNPLMYQPIIHREALSGSRGQLLGPAPPSPRPPSVKFAPSPAPSPRNGKHEYRKSPVRPILMERNSAKRESEAQTDITALPSHWRSESYLAHKVAHTFTTLPSKFALPMQPPPQNKYALRLADKTQEAHRTLLSDINFTSMVPELSRSADHLCQEEIGPGLCVNNYPRAHSYMKPAGSPCDCGLYRYRGSLTTIPVQPAYEPDVRRRHSWRPGPSPRPSWGSVPSSPTHQRVPFSPSYATGLSQYWGSARDSQYSLASSKVLNKMPPARARPRNVTFQESSLQRRSHPGQSLPDLRADFEHDSGDSTDSLIDEAEEYLRRSIDSILTGTDWSKVGRRRQTRRLSEPDPIREYTPPQCSQPFLPKVPRDLKLDYPVKVITGEGRVMMGRVRYVGAVPARTDPHVGVELPKDAGDSDGSFQGRRFFDCDPGHAVFVPFKKVVMAWSI